jgi:hypothetical protein
VKEGTKVYGCNLATGELVLRTVLKRLSHQYDGDMITVQIRGDKIRATGNHPFYVLSGDRLDSWPLPTDVPKEEQQTPGSGRWVEARNLTTIDAIMPSDIKASFGRLFAFYD